VIQSKREMVSWGRLKRDTKTKPGVLNLFLVSQRRRRSSKPAVGKRNGLAHDPRNNVENQPEKGKRITLPLGDKKLSDS